MNGIIWKILIFTFLISQQSLAIERPEVLYEKDNRLEYYELSSPLQEIARSTALLVSKITVKWQTPQVATLSQQTYGKLFQLCPEEKYFHEKRMGFCSATLVNETTLLTAGHCLQQRKCSQISAVFDFLKETENQDLSQVDDDQVYSCKKIIVQKNSQDIDFALIELDRPVTHRSAIAIETHPSLSPSDSVLMVGYPGGLPLKLVDRSPIRSVQSSGFVSEVDAFVGNSGSAIIHPNTLKIEGVLSRGEKDFVWDPHRRCHTTQRCSKQSCTGEYASFAKFAEAYLP